jgi:hypothetical protein
VENNENMKNAFNTQKTRSNFIAIMEKMMETMVLCMCAKMYPISDGAFYVWEQKWDG